MLKVSRCVNLSKRFSFLNHRFYVKPPGFCQPESPVLKLGMNLRVGQVLDNPNYRLDSDPETLLINVAHVETRRLGEPGPVLVGFPDGRLKLQGIRCTDA